MTNNAALEVLGATREQVIGHTDHDLFPVMQAEYFWQQDDAVMKLRASAPKIIADASGPKCGPKTAPSYDS